MFANMFEDAEDQQANQEAEALGALPQYVAARAPHCAYHMDLPPQSRQLSNFVGLQNQGATCYLNSLFQTLFMTPQFRDFIFQLKLDDDHKSNYKPKKFQILRTIQDLFAVMQENDIRQTSTEDLTKAFGWENNEHSQQHDVHELNRILFDALEQSLQGTEYDSVIQELFFGIQNNKITCQKCGESRIRQDRFLDLGLQVKEMKGVRESLDQLFTFEKFEGDNQLSCDSCGVKTDSLKGIEIGKLPPVITLNLYRFDLDYETWQRKKLDDRFEYPLELDMAKYVSDEVKANCEPEALIYELKSIVIHRGGAYGGHYFAYIKDDLKEGNWNLQKIDSADLQDKPVEKVTKKFDITEHMTEEQKKELEDEKNKNNAQESKKKKKNNKKNKDIIQLDYSLCDFPLPYSRQSLVEDWFEFNDSTVSPIQPGTLQSKFGGSSHDGNAYMLVYRQKAMGDQQTRPDLPGYQRDAISALNQQYEIDRAKYDDLKEQIEIYIQGMDLFEKEETKWGDPLVKYIQEKDFEKQGLEMRVRQSDQIKEVEMKVKDYFDIKEEFGLFEICKDSLNGYNRILNSFDSTGADTIAEANKISPISHQSTWLLVRGVENVQKFNMLQNSMPITLKIQIFGEEFDMITYNCLNVKDLQSQIVELFGENQYIMKAVTEYKIKVLKGDKQLKDFEIVDRTTIRVEIKEKEESDQEIAKVVEMVTLPESEDINLDDTPNLRSCLVHKEDGQMEKITVDILKMTISDLTKYIIKEFHLVGNYRLRNLTSGALYTSADCDSLLTSFEQFNEGGARIQIEQGRYLKESEGSIQVQLYGTSKGQLGFESMVFYFQKNDSVVQIKNEICEAFELYGEEFITQYTLYRLDNFGEPAFPIRKEKATFAKNNVSSGDLLILKNNKDATVDEKMTLGISVTCSGFPDDCIYIGDIVVNKEFKLNELKENIITMKYFQERQTITECIRLRDKLNNMFFGKIYRDSANARTLKQLGFKDKTHIVAQLLDVPEILDDHTFILLFAKRDVTTRTYSAKIEAKFVWTKEDKFPTIQQLKNCISESYGIKNGEHIEICKYIPHEFEWRHIDPNQQIEEKSGRKKKSKQLVRAGNIDIRKYPWFLQDGDIIGLRIERENVDKQDDFQTDADLIAKADFNMIKDQRQKAQAEEKRNKNLKKASDEHSLKINLDDE